VDHPEASADATADVTTNDGCVGYCNCLTTTHLLCQDFDGDGGLLGPFSTITSQGDASSQLDTTRFASSPRSATFTYDPFSIDGGWEGNALEYSTPLLASSITAEAKLFLPARPAFGNFETIDFEFPGWEINYVIESSQEILSIGCYPPCVKNAADAGPGYTTYPLQLQLPVNKWIDVKVMVTLGASFGLDVYYDGTLAASVPANAFTIPKQEPQFFIGADFASGSAPAFEVGVDDVTFDESP